MSHRCQPEIEIHHIRGVPQQSSANAIETKNKPEIKQKLEIESILPGDKLTETILEV